MFLFWFLAGMLTGAGAVVVLLPWLRTVPGLKSLPPLPWQMPLLALVVIGVALGLYHWVGRPEMSGSAATSAPVQPMSATAPAPAGAPAGSMTSAIASLESRLAKGGGSAEDWELLAKSYEFIGRPDAAALARSHQIAPSVVTPTLSSVAAELPSSAGAPAAAAPDTAPSRGPSLKGEIALAPGLRSRARRGTTVFVIARSVDKPGAPVAVFRSSVAEWPLRFSLDDSQAMIPGRNLSSAGRVIVEARISASGQASPASGDLHGSSGVIDPTQPQPLKILIDEVVD